MRRALLSLIVFLPWASGVSAAPLDGGRPGSFLDEAASARSLGMGNAYVGVADDASAVYWNPAGLAQLRRGNAVALYSALPEDTGFGFAGVGWPTAHAGSIGLGLVTLGTSGLTGRNDLGEETGRFSTRDSAALLSYATPGGRRLSGGATLKIVHEAVASSGGTGAGLDLGALYHVAGPFSLGLVARNLISPSVKLENDAVTYDRVLRLGGRFDAGSHVTLSADAGIGESQAARASAGAEWRVNELLALRAGINRNDFSVGFGVNIGNWGLDYAFGYPYAVSDVQNLGDAHRIGLHLDFGGASSPEVAAPAPAVVKSPDASDAAETARRTAAHARLDELTSAVDQSPNAAVLSASLVGDVSAARDRGYYDGDDAILADGLLAYIKGDAAHSVRALRKSARAHPNDPRLQRIVQRAERAAAHPDEDAAERRQMKSRFAAGDWLGTIRAAEALLADNARDAEAADYLNRSLANVIEPKMDAGRQNIEKTRYIDAYRDFQKVLTLDPENEEAAAYRARLVKVIERRSDIETAFGKTQTRPKSIGYYDEGLRLYALGRMREAEAMWQKALASANSAGVREALKSGLIDLRPEVQ